MNVGLYATQVQAKVLTQQESLERAYETYPESTLHWAFIDLIGSTNYRIARGARAGYVRGEVFFAIVRAVVDPTDVAIVKEIGDSVMLANADFRRLFEVLLLVHLVANRLGGQHAESEHPLRVRSAIGFGSAKRLTRAAPDYIGTPIDELARLMQLRSVGAQMLLHEDAFTTNRGVVEEYSQVVRVGNVKEAEAAATKGLATTLLFREVYIDDWHKTAEFREYFAPWRSRVGNKKAP